MPIDEGQFSLLDRSENELGYVRRFLERKSPRAYTLVEVVRGIDGPTNAALAEWEAFDEGTIEEAGSRRGDATESIRTLVRESDESAVAAVEAARAVSTISYYRAILEVLVDNGDVERGIGTDGETYYRAPRSDRYAEESSVLQSVLDTVGGDL